MEDDLKKIIFSWFLSYLGANLSWGWLSSLRLFSIQNEFIKLSYIWGLTKNNVWPKQLKNVIESFQKLNLTIIWLWVIRVFDSLLISYLKITNTMVGNSVGYLVRCWSVKGINYPILSMWQMSAMISNLWTSYEEDLDYIHCEWREYKWCQIYSGSPCLSDPL